MIDTNPPTLRIDTRKPPPGLYFVATPIGAARDITLRALDLLACADVLAAEDTRTLRHLMEIHGIPLNGRHIIAYHDHNGHEARPRILRALHEGKSVAYASEAGTPLVADPGFQLGKSAIAEGLPVFSAPGPSAVLAALTVSGLPSDRFLFAGFAPANAGPRQKWLQDLAKIDATTVIYESPKRVSKILEEMVPIFGNDREIAVCRELTKRFEEVRRGPLGGMARSLNGQVIKGEIVLVIGKPVACEVAEDDVRAALHEARASGLHLKLAAGQVADRFGMARRDVYQMGLDPERKAKQDDDETPD